jgi:hypothetical protein
LTGASNKVNNNMRAREFTINIPINIRFNDNGEAEIETPNKFDGQEPLDQEEVSTNFVPPLQQKIEMMKSAAGKEGDLIKQITADDDSPTS